MAQSSQTFLGTWEIAMCIIQPGTGPSNQDPTGIEGTVMKLEESGDVTWTVSAGAEDLPLISCETYDVFHTTLSNVVIRFGAHQGHIIEFRVDQPESPDQMLMTCDGWCLLHCRRSTTSEPGAAMDATFSLLPALEDGYFSDLTIVASNDKKFAVHLCILQLSAPELDWSAEPPPLTGLREDVVGTMLHYLYAECLPANLSELTAFQCINAASSYPSLAPFTTLCQHYLRNMALKQQIVSLVNDMHTCASHIIQHLSNKPAPASDSLNTNPAKLCFVVRQSLREAAVAGAKLVMLCDLFSKRKVDLTRDQRHEIIRYAKSRLPIFMNQLHRFLVSLKTTLSSMSPAQRQEIATYLVPEIETVLDILSSLGLKIKLALESIISTFNETTTSHKHRNLLSRTLHEVLHKRDLSKLKSLLQRHNHSLYMLLQRKEGFNEMTIGNKVRSVSRSLEQLVEELPVFLLRLEEVTAALDDKLEWREFKFCFKVGSSKVSGVLQRLLTYCPVVQPVLIQLCTLVARDAFQQALANMGLVPPVKGLNHDLHNTTPIKTHSTPKHHNYKLNLVEGLCMPPLSRNSRLSAAAIQLLRSGVGTDMVFEVVPSPEGGESVINQVGVEVASGVVPAEEVCSISAHRVVVAARCDWFRRALLSGMREAIDRKITVFDTSPSLFSVLLDYLYCGQLDTGSFSVDQLADLMLLADRYEVDSLKTVCEHGLRTHIDHDSVLYFLSMGDQFNAKHLRSSCLNFISQNPDIMDSELFEELPQNLQAEIYDLVIWAYPPSKVGDKLSAVQEMTANLQLSQCDTEAEGEVSGQDSGRLEACLRALRDVIGEEAASRQQLVQVALAADFDLNRALNFFYSS
uniref:BTB domain-containing protein n=1 Tax=Graphocephala atropunctata TaxID=36148 RepID=A0A1B6MP93_9HEMI